jgi:CDGSH-type Zn-finger protein
VSAEIEIVRGGPMRVRGAALGRLHHGGDAWRVDPIEAAQTYALCRCGSSSTMPMCDRTDDGACFEELPADAPAPGPFRWEVPPADGPPAVALKPDGPARVAGDVTITHGGAPVALDDGRTSLCRCAMSRCQPLCDSSHRASGFRG